MNPAVVPLISQGIEAVLDYFKRKNPTPEESAQAQTTLITVWGQLVEKFAEFESKIAALQTQVITAEAQGESPLQRNWRPLLMLTFTGLVVARWFGYAAEIPQEIELELWAIIKIGIGGYVGGRSVEKIAKEIAPVLAGVKK